MNYIVRKLRNFFFWGWKLRNDYQWDFHSVFPLLQIKLELLRKNCYFEGNHVWSEKSRQYKALAECIELCKKLDENENPYWDLYLDPIRDQEGTRDFVPTDDTMQWFMLKDTCTPHYAKQRSLAYKKGEQLQVDRVNRLFALMAKWHRQWWD